MAKVNSIKFKNDILEYKDAFEEAELNKEFLIKLKFLLSQGRFSDNIWTDIETVSVIPSVKEFSKKIKTNINNPSGFQAELKFRIEIYSVISSLESDKYTY